MSSTFFNFSLDINIFFHYVISMNKFNLKGEITMIKETYFCDKCKKQVLTEGKVINEYHE